MRSIDVVIPCYQYGRYLRQCVESVLTQEVKRLRVLIIDDASSDETPDVAADLVRRDARVLSFRHAFNKGHISTYNEGMEWVSADYMLLLSADDYLLPGALNRAIDVMERYPGVGFSFGQAFQLDDSGATTRLDDAVSTPAGLGFRILDGIEFIKLSASRNIVHTPTAVVRTKAQKRIGGYRAELPHSGDMEMWLRFASLASVAFIGAYQAVYRRHATNMSIAYARSNWLPDLQQRREAVEYFFRFRGQGLPNTQRLRRRALHSLSKDATSCASSAFNQGEMEMAEALSAFAVETCPTIRWSSAWAKLTCKRRLGWKRWNTLQPLLAKVQKL